jgi:hypothetical protein
LKQPEADVNLKVDIANNCRYLAVCMKKMKKVSNRSRPQKIHEMANTNRSRSWLATSGEIALRILNALNKTHITHVNKIMKGEENLTLETISKIENVLGIRLIIISQDAVVTPVMSDKAKIKPFIYHSFKEKLELEKNLMDSIPERKRKAVAESPKKSQEKRDLKND